MTAARRSVAAQIVAALAVDVPAQLWREPGSRALREPLSRAARARGLEIDMSRSEVRNALAEIAANNVKTEQVAA